MASTIQHPDRCSCGGLWIGGQCGRCGAMCTCSICQRERAEIAEMWTAGNTLVMRLRRASTDYRPHGVGWLLVEAADRIEELEKGSGGPR